MIVCLDQQNTHELYTVSIRPRMRFRTPDQQTLKLPNRGQQISWLAARSITHRFLRLYFPHLPEKADHPYVIPFYFCILPTECNLPDNRGNQVEVPFPTPQQVAQTEIATLRSAGLSGRKAEYGTHTLHRVG